MLRRLVEPLQRLLRQAPAAELVGVDKAGNKYFRQPKHLDGKDSERRWIIFRGTADPNLVPVEWTGWLAGTRKLPPSAEEIEAMERQRAETKLRARALAAEEEKRRSAKPLPAAESKGEGSAAEGAGGGRPRAAAPEPKGRSSSFQPEMWQPPDPPLRGTRKS